MAEDIVPGLLEDIESTYAKYTSQSKKLTTLAKKIEKGTASKLDAYTYANEIGNIRAKTFKKCLSSSVLPDGKMYYNIAERIVNGTLPADEKKIAEFCQIVQNNYNKSMKIGLKAQKATLDQSRLDGIIEKLVSGDIYDDVAWILDEPVKTWARGIVDDTEKANARFQSKAGIKLIVVRTSDGGCCQWCSALEGVYDYDDVKADGSEVWLRHDNCKCTIEVQAEK